MDMSDDNTSGGFGNHPETARPIDHLQEKKEFTMKRKMKRNLMTILTALCTVLLIAMLVPVSSFANGTEGTEDISVIYDTTDATVFEFTDSGIEVTEGAYSGYKISGTALSIKDSGTYVLTGNCQNGTIVVKKNVTGVVLILDGLMLGASATAPITCNKGSEVTIVAAEGSVNNLWDDEYNNDDIYTDEEQYSDIENAVIKCKDGSNVTICGKGTINITANGKNGIKGGYDLYEEDEDGNATDVLLSEASLTVCEVTLNITATVNDGLKSDKVLNILSGTITIAAADDGIKSDYVLNIGQEGTEGPVIVITESTEGIEAATLNVYSGNITVNATDDGINAANSDLEGYSFSYNQYGGYVIVNVTAGDGIDSNGTINLAGGVLEVYSPVQGDGDPLDADGGTTFSGATVLAVGHQAMPQGYSGLYVAFGGSAGTTGFGGMMGGMMGGAGTALVTAGSSFRITDGAGNVLYTATAIRNASNILYASPELAEGESYSLLNGDTTAATAAAGTNANAGMTPGGMMPGGQFPGNAESGQGQIPGGNGNQMPGIGNGGMMPGGGFPGEGFGGGMPDFDGEMPQMPEFPGAGTEMPGAPGENGMTPPHAREGQDSAGQPGEQDPSGQADGQDVIDDPADQETGEQEEELNWFQRIFKAIADFFRSLFGHGKTDN